ncbi:UrcA family protein [Parasphingorhabdus sp. DH2-15]|uniref:UrcA family protein n=1 Tax=Parasphingorhabdus sp. DH2-15 TaxID=3444112 RepID=UPI003F682A17
MRKLTKTLSATAIAALITIGTTGAAQANHDMNRSSTTVTVAYGDLNLASEDGAKRLENRIRGAARKVCGHQPNRNITAINDYNQCYKTAISSGKRAMVTLVAQAKSGAEFAENAKLSIGS